MRKVILGYGNGSGATWWRQGMPFKWIMKNTEHVALVSPRGIVDEDIAKADVIVLKGTVDQMGIASILAAREISGGKKKLVVDVDDALFVTQSNPHAKDWERLDASFTISQTIKAADLVTCTTPYLADKLRELNGNIAVIPNYYDPDWFNVRRQKNTDDTIRIGWAGSATHIEDIRFVMPVINNIMRKYPQVRLVVCGDPRFKDLVEDRSRLEIYAPVPIEHWPMRLAGMALDIGIAPLIDDEFNRCKSNIKFQEYSLCGIPSVCSRTVYEKDALRLATSPREWEVKLRELIDFPAFRVAEAHQAEIYVKKKYNIKNHYGEYLKAWGI